MIAPVCGGKMEARAGGSGTLATCWAGECSQAAIAEALNPAQERRGGPNGPKPARGPTNGSRADSGRFPAGSAEIEVVGSYVDAPKWASADSEPSWWQLAKYCRMSVYGRPR